MMQTLWMTKAREYVRSRAQWWMSAECIIERNIAPVFDIGTGLATGQDKTLIYEGKCRVWELTTGGQVLVNEQSIEMQNTQLSIPWDFGPVPIVDDLVTITDSATDTNMVGRMFEIIDMVKSGELRATRRFSVHLIQEKS
jgi:hypothetical protein